MKKKLSIYLIATAILLCCAVGGTIAWLTDQTDSVKNTFTFGDINIILDETTSNYKMVPGNTISKDPKVTVKANSEACWLFVKVEESSNFDDFMTYSIDSSWTALGTSYPGVYYREVAASASDQVFNVLTNNQVTVNESVTKEMFNDSSFVEPTLTFTAYAVQKDNISTATAAWAKISN